VADWASMSALGTAGGTLVLAAASRRSTPSRRRSSLGSAMIPGDGTDGSISSVARRRNLDRPDPRGAT
jgi:hypothetical protein